MLLQFLYVSEYALRWLFYKGEQLFQVQSGRPPGNKEVMYDDMGNVVAVIKLNPEKLPSHK